MVLKGLRANGRHMLAHEIAMNHLENVGRVYDRTGTFWENYEPETAAPGHPAKADYVGWTGLSPISILLEDVVGTGLTIGYVLQHLESFQPKSLRVCTLLDNPAKRLLNFDIHHICFTMPDLFVVGYGLDYNERYRNLREIVEYRK